jgi:multisubunit Na+/H+ antiporter MnhB subunit
MSLQLKAEELLMFIATLIIFPFLGYSWWWFAALILTPDVGMIGYLANTKVGAITYNLTHHKAIAVIVGLAGYYFNNNELQLAGLIMFSHSSLDRILGYGLKHPDNFKNTHLGKI